MIEKLEEIVGKQRVLTKPCDILPYGFDSTATLKGQASAVVFPRSTDEVSKVLRLCYEYSKPVVTRGSGTGLSGGSVPVKNSVVLCSLEMNHIIEIDTANLTLLVEPGVLTQSIDETAAQYDLFYPPDPSSMKISTIGGNVANNSGGLRGLKYGVTRDYIMGLEVVLADGTVHWLGNKCVKDVGGYSLRDIFIGSEGTLGVITQILLKLIPRPASKATLLATYASMEAAAQTVSNIIAARITPCTLEFLDQRTIRSVEAYASIGLPIDCEALLFMETDGHPAVVEDEARCMETIARKNGAMAVTRANDNAHALQLATARRSAFSALARIRPTTILEDVTVPRSKLATMVRRINETAEKHDLQIATFGHMGDGNLHPTFLTNERDAEEMQRVEKAMTEIFAHTVELGGTITGEHGVGLAKKPYLESQYGREGIALLQRMKQTLDPLGLLNPGKIFDLPVSKQP